MWHIRGRGEMHTGYLWVKLKETDLGADGRIILKCTLKKSFDKTWTGLTSLRIGVRGGV